MLPKGLIGAERPRLHDKVSNVAEILASDIEFWMESTDGCAPLVRLCQGLHRISFGDLFLRHLELRGVTGFNCLMNTEYRQG